MHDIKHLLKAHEAVPTVSFMHGPHLYIVPDIDVEKTREGRAFLYAAWHALPKLLEEIEGLRRELSK